MMMKFHYLALLFCFSPIAQVNATTPKSVTCTRTEYREEYIPGTDKNIIDSLITKKTPQDLDYINLARLINRYNNFPGEIEIKNDIEKILNFWKITKNELFSKTKNIWSKSFRPSNTNKDLVGSGFDTSN